MLSYVVNHKRPSNIVCHAMSFAVLCVVLPLTGEANTDAVLAEMNADVSLFEGDILRAAPTGRRSIGSPDARNLWVDGVVPYSLDPTFPQHSLKAINAAIAHWNAVSGITFMKVADVEKLQRSVVDSVYFKNNAGCASWVGRQGGVQDVWVGTNCTEGSVMHEIGHVLGLEHEHTRPDRDQYIDIHWDNISVGKTHNFDIASAGATVLGDYDYGSIMHYGQYNFSSAGQPTITPIYGAADAIGQRLAPSQGDLDTIAELYAADLSVIARVQAFTDSREATIYVANNDDQGANTVEVRLTIDASTVRAYSDNGWSCSKDNLNALVCSLDRLQGSSTSVLTLDLEPSEAISSFEAAVRSKTPDSNAFNNTSVSVTSREVIETAPVMAAAPQPQDDETSPTLAAAPSAVWSLLLLFVIRRYRACRCG